MKKYYGITESDLKNLIKNRFYQFLAFTQGYILLNGKKRQYAREDYSRKYSNASWNRKNDNSIPEGKYYSPVCFIAHDLVPKEYLDKFLKQSDRLIKKNMYGSHSFRFEDDRKRLMESIDKHAWNYDVWSGIGTIDFRRDRTLRKHIKCVEIKIMNVSVSYFALQVQVYLTPERQSAIENVINTNYKTDKYHTSMFLWPKKNGGAKRGWTLSRYNEDHLKSELVDAMMIETKWLLFNELSKWFRLQLHSKNIMPPSINVYKTNMHYSDDTAKKFFYSVGLKKWDGEFLEETTKIFFDIDRSSINRNRFKNFVYVVNEETSEKHDMFVSLDHQISTESEELYGVLFRFRIANYIGIYYHTVFSNFRNNIKKIKSNRTSRRRVLKSIYQFESDFAMFDRIYNEIDWDSEEKKLKKFFLEKEKIEYFRPIIRNLTTRGYAANVRRSLKVIADNKDQILEELNRKSELIKHKRDFEHENRDFFTTIVMLVITLLTLLVVVFDDLNDIFSVKVLDVLQWINNNLINSILMVMTLILVVIWNKLR